MGYLDFLELMNETRIVLTDSGGDDGLADALSNTVGEHRAPRNGRAPPGDDVRGKESQDRQLRRYLARTLALAEGLSGYREALRLVPETLDPVERLRHLPMPMDG